MAVWLCDISNGGGSCLTGGVNGGVVDGRKDGGGSFDKNSDGESGCGGKSVGHRWL